MNRSPPAILVVDDDVDTCRNLADILGDLGYGVAIAHDGPSALELVRQYPYEVAILDLKMPGMDGLTLYREIKAVRPGTVAIIVSAFANNLTAEAALAAGAWQVLPKPVDFPRLLGLVEKALDQPLIMVVDDDHQLCRNLWDLLGARGFRVCLAHDIAQAGDQLKNHAFKVVLIDMKLPGGDGTEIFRLVRSLNPQARTVLISGQRSEMEQKIQQVALEGADAICYKPLDVPNLLGIVGKLTGGDRLSAIGNRLSASDRQPTADSRQPVADSRGDSP